MDLPPLLSPTIPRLPPNRTHQRNASRSPTRERFTDDILADLSPTTTLEAFTQPSGKLKASIEAATASERAFGIRATLASKKIQEWLHELLSWPWPRDGGSQGFEMPNRKRLMATERGYFDDFRLGRYERHGSRELDDEEYMGSLLAEVVDKYYVRIEEITEDMEDLDVEAIKRQVLATHISSKSRPSSSSSNISVLSSLPSYTRMDDFTAIITATVIYALPNLSRLLRLMDIWKIRLIVLQRVPPLLSSLEEVEAALKSGWDVLGKSVYDHGQEAAPGEFLLSRNTFGLMQNVLQDKVTRLGRDIDFMLDTLEGREDTLPEIWLDRMEAIEHDYAEWVVSCEQKLRQGEWESQSRARRIAEDSMQLEAARTTEAIHLKAKEDAPDLKGWSEEQDSIDEEPLPIEEAIEQRTSDPQQPPNERCQDHEAASEIRGPIEAIAPTVSPQREMYVAESPKLHDHLSTDTHSTGDEEIAQTTSGISEQDHSLSPSSPSTSRGNRPEFDMLQTDESTRSTTSSESGWAIPSGPSPELLVDDGRVVEFSDHADVSAISPSEHELHHILPDLSQPSKVSASGTEPGSEVLMSNPSFNKFNVSPATKATDLIAHSDKINTSPTQFAAEASLTWDDEASKQRHGLTGDHPSPPPFVPVSALVNSVSSADSDMAIETLYLNQGNRSPGGDAEIVAPNAATLSKSASVDGLTSNTSSSASSQTSVSNGGASRRHSRNISIVNFSSFAVGHVEEQPFNQLSPTVPHLAKFDKLEDGDKLFAQPLESVQPVGESIVPERAPEADDKSTVPEAPVPSQPNCSVDETDSSLQKAVLNELSQPDEVTDLANDFRAATQKHEIPQLVKQIVLNSEEENLLKAKVTVDGNALDESSISSLPAVDTTRRASASSDTSPSAIRWGDGSSSPITTSPVLGGNTKTDEQIPTRHHIDSIILRSPENSPPNSPLSNTTISVPASAPNSLNFPTSPTFSISDASTVSVDTPVFGDVNVVAAPLSSPKKGTEDQLQQQISSLLESIPAQIHLSSGPTSNLSNTVKSKKTRKSVTPAFRPHSSLSNRAQTPSFLLAPAYSKTVPRPKSQYAHPEIKIYHLSRSTGEAPIKLFVRLVGENGERVMVRVGGGWADLGEYLKEYASHHGRRSTVEEKIEIQDLPPRVVSSSSTLSAATVTAIDNGRYSPVPSFRPSSAFDRPMSSLDVRKNRKSLGESTSIAGRDHRSPSTPLSAFNRRSLGENIPASSAGPSRSSSRLSWTDDDVSLGLAGPKGKQINMTEKDQEWVENMKEKVKLASAEKNREKEKERRLKDRGASFGEMEKVGSTKRLFRKA